MTRDEELPLLGVLELESAIKLTLAEILQFS